MPSPCGGCPSCCAECVFDSKGEAVADAQVATLVTSAEYGCVNGFGDIVRIGARVGQMRQSNFHAISERGQKFLQETKNPLATVGAAA